MATRLVTVRCSLLGLCLLALTVAAAAQEAPSLDERERRWLEEEVVHIISDYERAVFLALPDERARKDFIARFWTVRDPRPESRRNEGRDEHRRRTELADELFGERSRPGWSTPRGRLLVQLGPPDDRRSYPAEDGLREIEDWYYARAPLPGLPEGFHVLLYRESGDPTFRLYDPGLDGPASLVEKEGAAPLAVLEAASRELKALAVGLVPGVPQTDRRVYRLVERIAALHNRLPVDLAYARELADAAELEPSFHDHGFQIYAHGALDRADAGLLHVAVQVPPESLTLVSDGEYLQGALDVFGLMFPAAGGAPIAVLDERIDIGLTHAEFDRVKAHHFAFEDLVPLIAGDYVVQLIVRSVVTDEVVVLREPVSVPARSDGVSLAAPLLVSAAIPRDERLPRPFAFGDQVYYPVPGRRYSPSADIVALYQVAAPSSSDGDGKLRLRYEIVQGDEELIAGFERVALPAEGGLVVGRIRTGLRGVPPASYEFRVHATLDNGELLSVGTPFQVTPEVESVVPWVSVLERGHTPEWRSLERARQHGRSGDRDGAVREAEAALAAAATSAEARLFLADLRLAGGEHAAAYAAVQPLFDDDAATAVSALLVGGRAKAALGESVVAARLIEQAAALSPRSVLLLDELAAAAEAAGRTERAVAALERSLELAPDRKEIRSRLRRLSDDR